MWRRGTTNFELLVPFTGIWTAETRLVVLQTLWSWQIALRPFEIGQLVRWDAHRLAPVRSAAGITDIHKFHDVVGLPKSGERNVKGTTFRE